MGLLKEKIKNENNNQELSEDDKHLIMHVTIICSQLATQCAMFDLLEYQKKITDGD